MRYGWTIFKETPSGWQRVTKAIYSFPTACNVSQALELARGGRYCVNFVS